ncbi:hypothetical protein ACUN90_17035, partial [Escherichia sp. SP-MK2]
MNEFPVVLVINCGSSSIKFSVLDASDCEVLMSGIADGINSENAFLSVNGGEPAPLAHHSYEGALKAIIFSSLVGITAQMTRAFSLETIRSP